MCCEVPVSERFRNWGQGIGGVATALAVVSAAAWFWRREPHHPCGETNLEVWSSRIPDSEKTLLHVALVCKNVAEVPLSLGRIVVRFQQILPFDEELSARLDSSGDLIGPDDVGMAPEWPLIREREAAADPHSQTVVRPGEAQSFYADCVVEPYVRSVRVYGFVENRHNQGYGWGSEKIIELAAYVAGIVNEKGAE